MGLLVLSLLLPTEMMIQRSDRQDRLQGWICSSSFQTVFRNQISSICEVFDFQMVFGN